MSYACIMFTGLEERLHKECVDMRIQNPIMKQNPCIKKTACPILYLNTPISRKHI